MKVFASGLLILMVSCALSLIGGASKADNPTVERQKVAQALHRADDLASVGRYSALPGCSGDDVRNVLIEISRRIADDEMSDGADLRFALANAARDKKCYDTAKVNYEYMIINFTPPSLSDMRAQAGAELEKIIAIQKADRPPTPKPITLAAAMDAIQRFSSQQKCVGDATQPAQAAVSNLKDYSQRMQGVRKGPNRLMDMLADDAQHDHTSAAFALADAAKSKTCLDIAEAQYRDLINVYDGPAGAGVRDRAKIGLDDIREARAKIK